MTRPEILSAKVGRLAAMLADLERLKAMDPSERPGAETDGGQVSDRRVQECGERCIRSVVETSGSVGAIEYETKLPSERLADES